MNEKRPELSDITRLIRQAGEIIIQAGLHSGDVAIKSSHRDLVTVYDKKVQEFLVKGLKELYPRAGFFCEESASNSDCKSGVCFIIDPIDGTTNFVRGFNHSCVSIGCAIDGEIELGAVFDPFTDELFTAEKGRGAYLNENPIRCSENPLSEGLVMFGTSPYNDGNTEKSFALARALYDEALDIRRSGSAALDLCYVACGRVDLYFELSLQPWDYAAGYLIVREAGGVAGLAEGGEPDISKACAFAAGNAATHGRYLEIAQKIIDNV